MTRAGVEKSQRTLSGYLCISAASALFGLAGAVAKVLFNDNMSAVSLTALRSFCAAVALVPVIVFARARILPVNRAQLGHLGIMTILLIMVNLTFYIAISRTDVAVAIMLEYTAPVFVILIGLGQGTHLLNRASVTVLGMSVLGCYLLTGAYDADIFRANRLGLAAGLLCGLAFALYNMAGNRARRLDLETTTLTFHTFVMSAVGWLVLVPVLPLDRIDYRPSTVAYILFIGVFATVVPYWLLLRGLRQVDAFPATVIGMLDPVVAGLAAYLLVDERLALPQLAGIALLLVALVHMHCNERFLLRERPGEPAGTGQREEAVVN
ncbi:MULTISPECIES: EamA family transporter [Protofrankia]|uniref:EamA domain-containing protein n=1 Tax=Candidatus Protofrankia datiscae TaxID=2716812 RepID=F8B5Z9_9ACTN|nr:MULTISPECIES: DMT family transporter [Protofrankia]AEH11145.1 protein of unknown function DUF6 transmembrane [Candidatus Protofrankia datiscae]